jgi:hypothetical protein
MQNRVEATQFVKELLEIVFPKDKSNDYAIFMQKMS